MSTKVCPCCGKTFDSRGFKVHVFFCCGQETLKYVGKGTKEMIKIIESLSSTKKK